MPISKSICYLAFKDVAEKYLDPEDMENFMLEHQQRVDELKAADTLKSTTDAEAEAAKELATQKISEAILKKRNAAQQTVLTLRRLAWIKQNYAPHEYNMALKHMLGGTVGKRIQGASASVASKMDAYNAKAVCSFITELKRNNYEEFFTNKQNHRDIMIELGELREGGKPGITGNQVAQEIAQIMERHQDFWRQEANRNGAFIEKLPGYSIAQTHEISKLLPKRGESRDAAFYRWWNATKGLLDWGKTFKTGNPKIAVKRAREIWNGLVSGVHLDYTSGIGIATGGNRAQRLSNSRKIFFKPGDAFYKYNELFGSGDLVWGYIKGLERLSKNAALMGELGVNPQKTVDDLITALKITSSRASDPNAIRSMGLGEMFTHWDTGVYNLFIELTGKNKIPASEITAKVAQILRGVNSMARLGMATISSFPDVATQLSYTTFLGISKIESISNMSRMLTNLAEKNLTATEKQALSSFGLLSESLAMSFHDAINMGSVGNGWLAKAQNRYFRLTALDWWTTNLKKSMALSINHEIGEFLAKDGMWDKDLKHTMRATLEAYNIGAKELALLKEMPLIESGKRHYMDANYVHKIPDASFAKYLGIDEKVTGYKTRIENAKIDLEMKLRSFVNDQITAGVIEPNIVTRAWLNQGTQAGTFTGELWRSIMQFKSFAVSIVTQIANPWIYNTAGVERALGLGELFLTTTALGYLAMSCKDVVRGKTPPVFGPESMLRAMLQGGALGLVGDIMFGDANASSLIGSLAGPVPGMIDDLYHVYTKATDISQFGEDFDGDSYSKDVAAEAIKRFRNYIPYQNVFYMKGPLDYLLMYRLQEYFNPGYLDRLETNLRNKTGQEYWLSPGYFVR